MQKTLQHEIPELFMAEEISWKVKVSFCSFFFLHQDNGRELESLNPQGCWHLIWKWFVFCCLKENAHVFVWKKRSFYSLIGQKLLRKSVKLPRRWYFFTWCRYRFFIQFTKLLKKIKFKKSFLFARSLIKYFEISFPLAIYLLSNSWKMSCWNIEKVRMIFLPLPISIWFNLFWKCWSCCAILLYENKYFLNPS